MGVTRFDRKLLAAVEDGLPVASRPYAQIAAELGVAEQVVIDRLAALLRDGIIRRFGVIVRHHELGYTANAMTVWDVPDATVREVGQRIAGMPGVTLCYRRPRRLPAWPYNLFCMVHGRDRAAVQRTVEWITDQAGLRDAPRAVLFSRRRFKQRGARYAPASRLSRRSITQGAEA